MKDLLNYILETLTGKTNFEIEEKEGQDNQITYDVKADEEVLGLIIGRNGRTIKAIQDILRVKARLDNKSVWINVSGKNESPVKETKNTEAVEDSEPKKEEKETTDKEKKKTEKDTSSEDKAEEKDK